MATTIPTYSALISVEEYRKLINEHFSKQINDDQEYDVNDIKRFNEVDDYVLMFIQHSQHGQTFDEKKGFQTFHDAMSWRKQYKAYDLSLSEFPKEFIDRNAIYFKNHDINNCRLLHFVVSKFNKGEFNNELVKRFIALNLEEQIRNYPGKRLVILFDMTNTGLRHMDYDLIKFIISCLLHQYPGISSHLLVYKFPFILQAAWRIIKSWLPVETQNGVIFVDDRNIQNYISPDQLSKAMGGTAGDEA